MRTFKELCNGKVSTAIQAMIDGLYEMDSSPNFKIDMSTYGDAFGGICYGCAATCAAQKLTQTQFSLLEIPITSLRASACKIDFNDFDEFEDAIDYLRMGSFKNIWEYMGYSFNEIVSPDDLLPVLANEDTSQIYDDRVFWKRGLDAYQSYADKLVKLGF